MTTKAIALTRNTAKARWVRKDDLSNLEATLSKMAHTAETGYTFRKACVSLREVNTSDTKLVLDDSINSITLNLDGVANAACKSNCFFDPSNDGGSFSPVFTMPADVITKLLTAVSYKLEEVNALSVLGATVHRSSAVLVPSTARFNKHIINLEVCATVTSMEEKVYPVGTPPKKTIGVCGKLYDLVAKLQINADDIK